MRPESPEESLLRKKWKMYMALRAFLEEEGLELIVEGKHDRIALQNLGIRNKVTLINQSPEKVAEKVAARGATDAAVLTDFDRAGQELAGRMTEALESHGVKPNLEVRRKLRYLFGFLFVEELGGKVAEFAKKLERFER